MHVDQHRNEDSPSQNHVKGIGADPGKRKSVFQNSEHDRTEERANDGTRAPVKERATDDRRGNGHKHDLGAAGQRID